MQERDIGSGIPQNNAFHEDILGEIVPEDPKPDIFLEEYYTPTQDPPAWKIATGGIIYGSSYPQSVEYTSSNLGATKGHEDFSERQTSIIHTGQPGSDMSDY